MDCASLTGRVIKQEHRIVIRLVYLDGGRERKSTVEKRDSVGA